MERRKVEQPAMVQKVAPERAARAPYNFVPLPDEVRFVGEPPTGESYQEGTVSGWLDLEIECLTDFYIRGNWPLAEFLNLKQEEEGKKVKTQPLPFLVAGEPRVPGSSLRGMIRNLVEILCNAPLEQMADTRFFMRAVGSSSNSRHSSFESHGAKYAEIMGGGNSPRAKAGYLNGSKDIGKWNIVPAREADKLYRVKVDAEWERREVWFQPPDGDVMIPSDKWGYKGTAAPENASEGWLICGGNLGDKKLKRWIINKKGDGSPIPIPPGDVEAYLGDTTRNVGEKCFNYDLESRDVPCFFVEWEGHVFFGHSPYFRIPYEHTSKQVNPSRRRDNESGKFDMARAIFGHVPSRESVGDEARQGRVFFEDGMYISGEYHKEICVPNVLNSPKPTSYQHYLVQRRDQAADGIHWDSKGAVIRGFKLYWHRRGAIWNSSSEGKEKDTETEIQPIKEGARFKARLRFENLTPEEIGVLLLALELPEGCAHRLGMGKPLGLGSVRLTVKSASRVGRRKRYTSLLDQENGGMATGVELLNKEEAKDAFAKWLLGGHDTRTADLWEVDRFRELKALLSYDAVVPKKRNDWVEETRYMQLDEYKKRVNGRLQKRRPLPTPSQVFGGQPPGSVFPRETDRSAARQELTKGVRESAVAREESKKKSEEKMDAWQKKLLEKQKELKLKK